MANVRLLLLITVIILSSELVKIFCTKNQPLNLTQFEKVHVPVASKNDALDNSTEAAEFGAYYDQLVIEYDPSDKSANRYYNQTLVSEVENTTLTFYPEKSSDDLVKGWIRENAIAGESRKSDEQYDENNTIANANWNSSQYKHKFQPQIGGNASSILELRETVIYENETSSVSKKQVEKPQCIRNHRTKKWPFFGPGFSLRRCTGNRRPLRCRRYRRRRRRRTTTPRASAMLANFTFVNNVNNQNYLTQSSGSNVTQLTNSSFPSPKE